MGAASPTTLSDYRALVQAEVKDQGERLRIPDDYDIAILDAVKEYTVDIDNVVNVSIAGANNRYFAALTATNFPGWVEGFSMVRDIDTAAKPAPIGNALPVDVDPSWLEIQKDVEYRWIGTTKYIFTPYFAAQIGDLWRVYYTTYHTINGLDGATTTSIFPHHTRAIVALAGSYACLKLAALYADMTELNQFNADVVDYRTRSDMYSNRSKTLRSNYVEVIGQPSDASPASVVGKFQERFQWDRPFLTHRFRGSA